ncbi:glutaredoxin-C4-like isoform X2 [Paramuricea clavata]|uniref:Glutaredoxin-2, mitochondrial n=1 Tax=Paramuricea clavata TaxID=317549 RepID=A0A6S7IT27_PARCT|nr:glutaredoxin-C4-like isoform X2 [Paramuricea clavata]
MSKKDWVEAQIKSDKVVIFSKSYCPFCKKAKQAFTDAGLKNFLVIELDTRDDGSEIQDILLGITGARSVPRVFIGGEFIGGGSETAELQSSGKLVPKLKSVGAL